jgi:hypothetical protein
MCRQISKIPQVVASPVTFCYFLIVHILERFQENIKKYVTFSALFRAVNNAAIMYIRITDFRPAVDPKLSLPYFIYRLESSFKLTETIDE